MPAPDLHAEAISLSAAMLPEYALRTTLRMLAALALSLAFTLVYGTLAAKSRRAEKVLIPLLDILQSVPVLGYVSFTVVFFLALFPGRALGAELAAIFAIFTSQAWNMTFSFYQSLRSLPRDLLEASANMRLTPWQRFWKLEAPYAVPGLAWNMMMSMSGGWFFVVASEAITVGDRSIRLPGVGAYLAEAIAATDLAAVAWVILAMAITILAYDQFLFRPVVAWADRFRMDGTAGQAAPRSWVLDLVRRTRLIQRVLQPCGRALRAVARARLAPVRATRHRAARPRLGRIVDLIWNSLVILVTTYLGWRVVAYARAEVDFAEFARVLGLGLLTLLRVAVLVALASLVWVPLGVLIGLRPRLAEKIQPLAQFLAAFPANLLFPVFVVTIVRLHLNPDIWLSPLIVLGVQWYILFNVIAGASVFPNDLREASANLRIRGWQWWRQVMLPGVFPYTVTGAITAYGGAWNASIVSESVSWGATTLNAHGLGAYIAQATAAGDYPRIVLGIAVMVGMVASLNWLVWRPLSAMAENKLRMN
jgi:NitT/TauT family transport system permease protein